MFSCSETEKNFRFFKCCYFNSFFGLVMHFRDSGIIYGPFWGSFAVVDELRYCTVHLSFMSTHNQTIKESIIKWNKGNQSGVQRGHQGGPRLLMEAFFLRNGNEHLSLGLKG